MQDRQILNAEELAKVIGANPLVVRRWAAAGVIPAHRIGGTWRFVLSEVLDSTRNSN